MNDMKQYFKRIDFKLVALAAMLSAALASCNAGRDLGRRFKSLFAASSQKSQGKNPKESSPASGGAEVTYEYFTVKRGEISQDQVISGRLVYKEQNLLRADKRMKLAGVLKAVDDIVKKGDPLLKVDTKDLEAKKLSLTDRLKQAEIDHRAATVQLQFARKQLERRAKLAARGISAQKDLEETERQVKAAEVNVQSKDLDLQKAKREFQEVSDFTIGSDIVSPIDGIITSISRGSEDVGPGQIVASVARPGQLQFQGVAEESAGMFVGKGKPVTVSLPDKNQVKVAAKISSVAVTQSDRYGQKGYSFSVDIPEGAVDKYNLRDGYNAVVNLRVRNKSDAVLIPIGALQAVGESKLVLVAAGVGAGVTARAVKTGIATELEVEVAEGLAPGEIVAVPTGGTR